MISIEELASQAKEIIEQQEKDGSWVVHQDKFRREVRGRRWNGEYRVEDRISSALFNRNVAVLCSFMEEFERLSEK